MDMMTRRRAMMGNSKEDIDNYVKNGIVFWLDGVKNTRQGHNAQSTTWQDLAGTRNVTYSSNKVIADKYCIPNGKSNVSVLTGITSTYTIEVVLEYVSNGSTQMLLPWGSNGAYGVTWISANGGLMFNAGSSNKGKGATIPAGINTITARGIGNICINGEVAAIVTSSNTWNITYGNIFYYNSQYPRPCVSKIYAIRVYNRTLTDAEVAQNVAVDAARFGRTS
jgi:hypothetical protein